MEAGMHERRETHTRIDVLKGKGGKVKK